MTDVCAPPRAETLAGMWGALGEFGNQGPAVTTTVDLHEQITTRQGFLGGEAHLESLVKLSQAESMVARRPEDSEPMEAT